LDYAGYRKVFFGLEADTSATYILDGGDDGPFA
jgi:hypothetical protein